jgi:hypothetical protein
MEIGESIHPWNDNGINPKLKKTDSGSRKDSFYFCMHSFKLEQEIGLLSKAKGEE